MDTYLTRLAQRSAKTGTVLCLGLDPDPGFLPPGFSSDVAGIEAFGRLLLDAAGPYAAAVKPNLAFFEAYGSPGLAVLERLRSRIPGDLPVVLDGKRGDIGSTAARQAVALFDQLGADAVTANPYLGSDAIAPLLERVDRFVYVLCRTTNPGAGEFQDLIVAESQGSPESGDPAPREPLYQRLARRVATWGPGGTAGLVVGATAPGELAAVRAIAPGVAFLVPGVGAQGGEIAPVLAHGPATSSPAGSGAGRGLIANVSRGVVKEALEALEKAGGGDLGEHLAKAAQTWAARLPVLT